MVGVMANVLILRPVTIPSVIHVPRNESREKTTWSPGKPSPPHRQREPLVQASPDHEIRIAMTYFGWISDMVQ